MGINGEKWGEMRRDVGYRERWGERGRYGERWGEIERD